eukprot:2485029-Rhodomonas_salina.1
MQSSTISVHNALGSRLHVVDFARTHTRHTRLTCAGGVGGNTRHTWHTPLLLPLALLAVPTRP